MKGAARNPIGIRVAYGAATLLARKSITYSLPHFEPIFP